MADIAAATARTASKLRSQRERRHLAILAGIFVTIMCLGGWLAATWDVFNHIARRDSAWTWLGGETDARSAKIVYDVAGQKCRELLFDNDTGQISGSGRPCVGAGSGPDKPSPTASAPMVPEPLGTIRRLEAISKSFNK
ncbi:MAG: hypothetical protein IT537_09365 [Hyphomicrobiales bacterium]|nr:hypothetical protein [Hyphomicrobiales bacterium]